MELIMGLGLIPGILGLVFLISWFVVANTFGRMSRCLEVTFAQQQRIAEKTNYTNRLLEEILVRLTGEPMPKVDSTQDEIMADMGITFNGKRYLINGEPFGARHEPQPRTSEEAIAMAKERGMA